MDEKSELEEKLRESACIGDLGELKKLIETKSVDVNSQNSVNGWTPLHWAAKRNHQTVVSYLLSVGADPSVLNKNGETPVQMSTDKQIQQVLGGDESLEVHQSDLPITPNYLAHPPFPYMNSGQATQAFTPAAPITTCLSADELVLKARLANSDERDFIEVELPRNQLTYETLLNLLCTELECDKRLVYKIRKLPDTIVRKDKDVKRLVDFQELEVVLSNKVISASSRNYGVVGGAVPRQEQILY